MFKEYEYGIKSHQLSNNTWKIVLLEGDTMEVTTSGAGFHCKNEVFESVDSLLNAKSPLYRDAFHQQLSQKLSDIQNE